MATGSFTVFGQRLRTSSTRRYVVFARNARRPKQTGVSNGRITFEDTPIVWSAPFIDYRSDSLDTAQRRARARHASAGFMWQTAIVDTHTGTTVGGDSRKRPPHPRTRAERLVIQKELARRRAAARKQERNTLGLFR